MVLYQHLSYYARLYGIILAFYVIMPEFYGSIPELFGKVQQHKSNLNNDCWRRESKANSLESETRVPKFGQQHIAQDGLLTTRMFWAHAKSS